MVNKAGKYLFRNSRYIKVIFLFWDFILLNLTFFASFIIRYATFKIHVKDENWIMLLVANMAWLVITFQFKAYKFIRTEPIERILYKVFKMFSVLFIVLFTFLVILNYDNISRLQMAYFISAFFILVFIFRILFIHGLKRLRKSGFNYRNYIVIGTNANGSAIASILTRDVSYGYRFLGYFSDTDQVTSGGMIIGRIKDALNYIIENHVHEVYLSISNIDNSYSKELVKYCEDNLIRIKLVPDFSNFTKSRKVQIDFYDNIPVISMRSEPLESTMNRVFKRTFDIFFSIILILTIFPWLFPLLMLFVKLSSKGPIFFKQERSGEQNKTFWCYKFRTMKVNDLSDELQATKDDKRITPVGKFLRRSNLDELPQFFNVLWGDMSVVGPRPHMLKHTKEYSELISAFLVRHLVKPGITGWAQVNGFRGETINIEQMEKRVEFDIWYIENWSFLLDMKIIYLTIRNMFSGNRNAV
jgi:putative colanic acid biosynthesis UDP-glucose lipid carrier transferase